MQIIVDIIYSINFYLYYFMHRHVHFFVIEFPSICALFTLIRKKVLKLFSNSRRCQRTFRIYLTIKNGFLVVYFLYLPNYNTT